MRHSPFLIWLVIFAGWIAAEISVFNLVASWTGGMMAFLLFILKSVAGFSFVGKLVRKKLAGLSSGRFANATGGTIDLTVLNGVSLKVTGAILLVIPGFLAGILGLALLTPSIRSLLSRNAERNPHHPREIDLPSGDWTEVPAEPAKRLRRRKLPDSSL